MGGRPADRTRLADDPHVYFTTPHFEGYPAVLVRLERIGIEELEELIVESLLARAPKRLCRRVCRHAPRGWCVVTVRVQLS